MKDKGGRFLHAFCVGLSLLAVASCSLLGASLNPLTNADSTCTPCEQGCVDLRSNATSCGACGAACGPGEACVDGQCRFACPAGQLACGSACFEANDPAHCGDCATSCKPDEVCGNGRCGAACPADQMNCSGACVDPQTDPKNCGGCGVVCGTNDECFQGACVIACKTQLNQPLVDAWGWSWDGLERAASPFADAQTTCSQFRGRLPTSSELYRVSATQSATVGQTIHTNPLWSLAPVSPGNHVRVRLSDAAVTDAADTSKANYRCVCPPPMPKTFSGNNCFGPPNTNACAPLASEGGLRAIDTQDRAPVPKTAAVWECAFDKAHLATTLQLAEAIEQGVGPGSGNWLHSADEVRKDASAVVNWTTRDKFVFDYKNAGDSVGFRAPTDSAAFRCVGETSAVPAPPLGAGQWAAPSRRNIEAADLPEATAIDAVDHCFQNGGHLPTVAELNELVAQGAPAGSGTFLWTSDHTGSNGTNHTNATVKWKDVQTDHLYGGADMDWSYKTDTRPYRCIYYPVDTAYAGPQGIACAGGCMTVAMPGTSGAKSWFDNNDRPPANVNDALEVCRNFGGHLASERDLTEAIRAGLPSGSGDFLNTSDAELGSCGTVWGVCDAVTLFVGTVRWTDTQPTFDDLWVNSPDKRMDWAKAKTVNPYRCMWTNELR